MTQKIKEINKDGKKSFLILETNSTKLQMVKEESVTDGDKKSYVFSGPCADFNDVNDNGRLYDKEDYLSHIEYLKDDIAQNRLLGEVDHAENDFDPKMRDISHIIKDLWYDEEKNQVWIKIKIIANRFGKDLMAAVDEGVPIYISSRATGFIDDSGNVTLERIYTYDIVYRPGFANAKLERLNESLNIKNDRVAILDVEKNESLIHNKINENMSEFVTKQEMEKYSNGVKQSFDNLTKEIKKLNESKVIQSGRNDFQNKGGKDLMKLFEDHKQDIQKRIENLPNIVEQHKVNEGLFEREAIFEHIDSIATRINETGKYVNILSTFMNESTSRIDNLEKAFVDFLKESNKIIGRVNDLTDIIQEDVITKVNNLGKYNKLVTESMNINSDNIKKLNAKIVESGDIKAGSIFTNSDTRFTVTSVENGTVCYECVTKDETKTGTASLGLFKQAVGLNEDVTEFKKDSVDKFEVAPDKSTVKFTDKNGNTVMYDIDDATADILMSKDAMKVLNTSMDLLANGTPVKVGESEMNECMNDKQSETCTNLFGKCDDLDAEKVTFSADTKIGDKDIKAGDYVKVPQDDDIYLLDNDGKEMLVSKADFEAAVKPAAANEAFTEEEGKAFARVRQMLNGKGDATVDTVKQYVESNFPKTSNAAAKADAVTKISGLLGIKENKKDYQAETKKLLEQKERQRQERDKLILETKYPFIKNLNEQMRREFLSLHEINKKRIAEGIQSGTINASNIEEHINECKQTNTLVQKVVTEMPTEFVKIWESLNKPMKESILALYQLKEPKPGYETEMFWKTIDFGDSKGIINESLITEMSSNSNMEGSLGYSDKFVEDMVSR